MEQNFWFEAGEGIVRAFFDEGRSVARAVRLECAGRALLSHLPPRKLNLVDIGGGHAGQALWFARRGHSVVVVDPDRRMLAKAEQSLALESEEIRARVFLVEAVGQEAHISLGRRFDGVLCHSVIPYLSEVRPLFDALAGLCEAGGVVSLIAHDPRSTAMRSAQARDWRNAVESIRTGRETSPQFAKDAARDRETVERLIEEAGLRVVERLGSGVFVDHVRETVRNEEFAEIVEAEWWGGRTDPYRSIARCFHLICKPK